MTSNNALTTYKNIPPVSQFDAYCRAVNNIPLLSEADEHQLALKVEETADQQAAMQLAIPHLRLPVKVAFEHKGYGIPLEDLVQEGNIGLLKAIKKFDPHMGVRLSVLALAWIRAEIRAYILKNWKNVRIATNKKLRHLFFTFRKEKQVLESAGISGQELTTMLAHKLGVSEDDLRDFETRITSEHSFDAPLLESPNTLHEIVAYDRDHAEDYIENSTQAYYQEKLTKAINSLPERTRRILIERKIDDPPKSLKQISEEMGISVGRVHQIEEQAMKQLKNIFNKQLQLTKT